MTCVKTGCDVYLESHGGALHGDMFRIGNVWIFHHCGMETVNFEADEMSCDYVFMNSSAAPGEGDLYLESACIIAFVDNDVEEL